MDGCNCCQCWWWLSALTSRPQAEHFSGPLHHCSTILSALGLPFPHGFIFGNSRATSQWVTHPGSALASFSLNFGVPTEPEASELPKGLVLGRDGNIHLRITPLGDVGCYNPPTLGARPTSQWVTHPVSALAFFSLNFGVPTEPEASELPKCLVLGRDGNIHLRITPLGDVGCYISCPGRRIEGYLRVRGSTEER
ncbi:hypothetical protein DVH24_016738 [Malus domestica]|uniref:Uncharacterized protein n=1 Tax=Malus domestica TaxID=3750 RepID=A0A498HR25_MALDO|nr:hypothetical protein DVH24_016738 [Malus domestica]